MSKKAIASSIIVFISIMVFALSSSMGRRIITKIISEKPKYVNIEIDTKPILTSWEMEMLVEVPKPGGVTSFEKYSTYEDNSHAIICNGVDALELKNYEEGLLKVGFNQKTYNKDYHVYIKGNLRVSIRDDSASSFGEYITVLTSIFKTDKDLKDGELTTVEAKSKIQDYINDIKNNKSNLIGRQVEDVYHKEIPSAWEKMKLQAFTTSNMGYFIIQNGKVSQVSGLERPVVVDIDKDGEFELINLYGYGSGIYSTHIWVYKNGKIISNNDWTPYNYFDKLALEKIDDTTIKLRRIEYNGSKYELTADYGKLKIVKNKGKNKIRPEKIMRFPFEEYDIE